ncbi:endonuclease VII domain-containing protein [Acinetobacter sp.]|uniref:endonuclease VII domain-containing protein n=1 Tax=Acinetobacter sp. TaxID=472 RepID=UPI003753D636
MKLCKKCNLPKDEAEFHKNKANKTGLSSYCKPCAKIAGREWGQKFPEKKHAQHVKQTYGLTAEEYQKKCDEQNNVCAICASTDKRAFRLSVDHCHSTGKVRGLLCNKCNLTLGWYEQIKEQAIAYLSKF